MAGSELSSFQLLSEVSASDGKYFSTWNMLLYKTEQSISFSYFYCYKDLQWALHYIKSEESMFWQHSSLLAHLFALGLSGVLEEAWVEGKHLEEFWNQIIYYKKWSYNLV